MKSDKKNYEFDCNKCLRKGTTVCQHCAYAITPSGKMSRPSFYKEKEEKAPDKNIVVVCVVGRKKGELLPKEQHDAARLKDIKAAVNECLKDGKSIPDEWIKEYNELSNK